MNNTSKTTTEEQLRAFVKERLNGRSSVHDLHISVQNRGLVLQGHAPNYYAKQLAQEAVMAITRLPILANEIEVQRAVL